MPSPPLTRREYAYFSATGDGSPDIITRVLGEPSQSWAVGDPGPGGPRKFMRWKLESGLDDTEPLEKHIESLLAILEPKSSALQHLMPSYHLTLQCVGYYPASGHGAHFDRDAVRRVASLGLAIDLDFYYVDDPHE